MNVQMPSELDERCITHRWCTWCPHESEHEVNTCHSVMILYSS